MGEGFKMKSNCDERLWTRSLFILWQGQLVSSLGDAAYSIALGFWVLKVTGSTALMGTLMAASTLPGVIIAPFAGTLIDRNNRKKLLILMDLLRGFSIALLGILAYNNNIKVWMVFIAGIILSICGAIFSPGINSSIPDLVPKSKITNANSVFAIVTNGANMLGNIAGGFLFQIIGAPLMFLFNGLSFVFSGFSILLVKIPAIEKKNNQCFLEDLKDGFSFVWQLKGLRYTLLIAAVDNFFANIAIILLLPLFQKTPNLGSAKYGIVMACFMGGMFVGFILTSIINIPALKKLKIFIISGIIYNVCLIIAVSQSILIIMALMIFVGGTFNAIFNVLIMSSVQLATPQEKRGKVISFITMVTQGLTPFAMALGGVLGSFLPIRSVMSTCFIITLLLVIPFAFNKHFKRFINFDYENQTVEDIML